MSKASRDKGGRGERELARLLRAHGWTRAARTSDGRAQAARGDIADGPEGVHIEVKRCETAQPWKWHAQAVADADGTGLEPVVVFRRSRSPWLVIAELEDILPLWRMREVA